MDFDGYLRRTSGYRRKRGIIAFGASGGWTAVRGKNGFLCSNVSADLAARLERLNAENKKVHNISLSQKNQGGYWISDEDGSQWTGLGPDLNQQLKTTHWSRRQKSPALHVCEGKEGEWLIIRDEEFSASADVPELLEKELARFYRQQYEFRVKHTDERIGRELAAKKEELRGSTQRWWQMQSTLPDEEALFLQNSRLLAIRHGYIETKHNEHTKVVCFHNGHVQINVAYAVRTVGVLFGRSQLLCSAVSAAQLRQIFESPKVHTDLSLDYSKLDDYAKEPVMHAHVSKGRGAEPRTCSMTKTDGGSTRRADPRVKAKKQVQRRRTVKGSPDGRTDLKREKGKEQKRGKKKAKKSKRSVVSFATRKATSSRHKKEAVQPAHLTQARALERAQAQANTSSTAPPGEEPDSNARQAESFEVSETVAVDLRRMFGQADCDDDGVVNKRELILALRKDPALCEMLGMPSHIRQEDGSTGSSSNGMSEDSSADCTSSDEFEDQGAGEAEAFNVEPIRSSNMTIGSHKAPIEQSVAPTWNASGAPNEAGRISPSALQFSQLVASYPARAPSKQAPHIPPLGSLPRKPRDTPHHLCKTVSLGGVAGSGSLGLSFEGSTSRIRAFRAHAQLQSIVGTPRAETMTGINRPARTPRQGKLAGGSMGTLFPPNAGSTTGGYAGHAPLKAAGLLEGDLITSVKVVVQGVRHFRAMLLDKKGLPLMLFVLRKGERLKRTIRCADHTSDGGKGKATGCCGLGFTVSATRPLIVTGFTDAEVAVNSGLLVGDAIDEAVVPTRSSRDVTCAVKSLSPGTSVTITAMRTHWRADFEPGNI
jgi:hypothetical protein